jgi:type IV secretion system protein VirB4
MYLDAYLGGQELWTGDTPRYGDKFICCVHIEGFPSQAYPNILGFLDSLPLTYRWSTRFIYLDRHTALKELNRYRRQWRQKTRGFFQQVFRISSGQINEDALLMAKQADTAITDAQSAVVTFGYYSSVVVLMGEERQPLDEQARVVVRELRRQGFNGRKETINTLQSWLGTLAGHPEPNVRRPLLHTLNLSDLMPLSGVWAGRAVNPCPLYPADSPPLLQAATTGNTPFRLNLHVSDVGHTLIFGPTGAGKSTLLCLIMAQFLRYPGGTIAAFDNGRSMFALCHAVGGRFYDLGAGRSDIGFAPLQYLDNDNDVAWAAEWITTCFELQAGHRPSPRQKEAINRALKLLRESPEGRSLTDFTASLQDAEVRDALRYYTLDGPLGQLLDSREDGLQEDRVQVFEMSELMGLGPATLLPVMLYLFRRIDKMAHGQPGLLPVDEAWLALGHPVFREKLRDWFKKKRKENWAIVPATQSLSDATRSGILDVLMESCPTKIFLPNEEADKTGTPESPGPNELYRMFGLNEVEIELIRTAQKKRHYYYTSPEGHRLFDLALGPIALSFVGISSAEDIARIRQLMDEHRDHWPFAWLKERGIADEPRAA